MGNIKLFVLSTVFFGQLAFASCGSTISGGGKGSTSQTNTHSPCTGSQTGSTPVHNTSMSPSFSSAAHQQKQCADEKGKIENENGKCMYETALDYQREVSRCNEIGNSETSVSGGGDASGKFVGVFLSATYTIQDPTYEKCFNLVTALNNTGEKLCAVRKANQEDIARKWNNAQCKDFYM